MNKLLKQVSIFDLLWFLPTMSAFLYGFFNIIWWQDAGKDDLRSLVIFMSHVVMFCCGVGYRMIRYLDGSHTVDR